MVALNRKSSTSGSKRSPGTTLLYGLAAICLLIGASGFLHSPELDVEGPAPLAALVNVPPAPAAPEFVPCMIPDLEPASPAWSQALPGYSDPLLTSGPLPEDIPLEDPSAGSSLPASDPDNAPSSSRSGGGAESQDAGARELALRARISIRSAPR